MWQSVTLPFQNNNIPALPDVCEIRQCTTILKERSYSKVVAVNDNLIVKFGSGIETWEGQALLYLEREVLNVPAPRLYAMYQDAEETFLVMQRVPGVSLDTIWTSLTEVGRILLSNSFASFSRLCEPRNPLGRTSWEAWMAGVSITICSTTRKAAEVTLGLSMTKPLSLREWLGTSGRWLKGMADRITKSDSTKSISPKYCKTIDAYSLTGTHNDRTSW